MHADLDTLCTLRLLHSRRPSARSACQRKATDHLHRAVTLCVAQTIIVPSDRRFLAVAKKRLIHLFP